MNKLLCYHYYYYYHLLILILRTSKAKHTSDMGNQRRIEPFETVSLSAFSIRISFVSVMAVPPGFLSKHCFIFHIFQEQKSS